MRPFIRLLLVSLMITMLPMRGWAGDVMATEMASSQIQRVHQQAEFTIKLIAASQINTLAKGDVHGGKPSFELQKQSSIAVVPKAMAGHDCDGHVASTPTVLADAQCDSCPTCQACGTVALSAAVVDLTVTFSSRALPRPVATQFASAIAALGQKPPIA